jgi:hypothetical protein
MVSFTLDQSSTTATTWHLTKANVGISPKRGKAFAGKIRATLNGVRDGTARAASWPPESERATGFAKLSWHHASPDSAQPLLRYAFQRPSPRIGCI